MTPFTGHAEVARGIRSRVLVHPGPAQQHRIEHKQVRRARQFRLSLSPGHSLHEGIVLPLMDMGVRAASMTLLGGQLEGLQYCVAPPDPTGERVATYGRPRVTEHAFLVFGNATLGSGSDGSPIVHCHAVFRLTSGDVRGGHVLTDRTTVGEHAPTVLVTAIDGLRLVLEYDEETNIELLKPALETSNA